MRSHLRLGLWTLGAPDVIRLREREAMFVPVRWMFVLFAALALAADDGRFPIVAWLTPPLVVAANLAASALPARIGSVRRLHALGVAVNVFDGAVVAASMFNYGANADTATGLVLMLVVFEGALRFGTRGGLIAGLAAGITNVAWMAFRDAEYGFGFTASTAGARMGTYLLAGGLLGVIVSQLEGTGHQVRAQVRRTDAVGRFAVDAPRLDVDAAADRLAKVLHENLGHEFAAVVVVDEDDPHSFRLVALAGYADDAVERYARFPVSEGIVGRCFRTGTAQLVSEIADDPDYMQVDSRTRSEMTVPLRARGEVFGAIDVASSRPGAFDQEDLRFLEAVAVQLGVAFDNARIAAMERKTIAELEELAALKDDFIAIANHELRTPVTTIAGFAQSLLKQRSVLTDEELDDAIERIARQSSHLKRLIEDLLTIPGSRGRRGLRPEYVKLPDVAAEVVRELDPADGIHNVRVDMDLALPPLEADRSALRRVLTNLIGNAIKYSPLGGEVTVRATRSDDHLLVEVVDEGTGVEPADLPMLFTKFGKVGTADSGGMGLGLFIVKELVEDMSGSVGVHSVPGEGSTFWFRVPVLRARVGA